MIVWQEAGLFVFSAIKFFLAPPAGVALGFSFFKVLAITTAGGISGVFFFYYFGRLVNRAFRKIFRKVKKQKDNCRKFTFTNKLIIKTKMALGVNGLALLSPILISIPIGTVLASRYFKKYTTPIYFSVWVVFWSFSLTGLSLLFKDFFTSLVE